MFAPLPDKVHACCVQNDTLPQPSSEWCCSSQHIYDSSSFSRYKIQYEFAQDARMFPAVEEVTMFIWSVSSYLRFTSDLIPLQGWRACSRKGWGPKGAICHIRHIWLMPKHRVYLKAWFVRRRLISASRNTFFTRYNDAVFDVRPLSGLQAGNISSVTGQPASTWLSLFLLLSSGWKASLQRYGLKLSMGLSPFSNPHRIHTERLGAMDNKPSKPLWVCQLFRYIQTHTHTCARTHTYASRQQHFDKSELIVNRTSAINADSTAQGIPCALVSGKLLPAH